MGGSKRKAKPIKKAKPTVPTKFDCLFCNHSQTVECKLNYQNNLGTIKCRVCVGKGSLITLSNGVSVPIESLVSGRDNVLGWQRAAANTSNVNDNDTENGDTAANIDKSGLVSASVTHFTNQGVKPCIQVTLSDGRELTCTPDHRVLTSRGEWCEAQSLVIGEDSLAVGIQYPLYAPDAQSTWSRQYGAYTLRVNNMIDMLKSIAFARLLGLVESDGKIASKKTNSTAVFIGHELDAVSVLNDIKLLTGVTTALPSLDTTIYGGIYRVYIPEVLSKAFIECNVLRGKRVNQAPKWPSFIQDDSCPPVLIRAYFAGLFGGDGHSPSLSQNTVTSGIEKVHKEDIRDVMLSLTKTMQHVEALHTFFNDMRRLLARCGIPLSETNVYKAKDQRNTISPIGQRMLSRGKQEIILVIHDVVSFYNSIGFYGNVHKQQRLAAVASFYSLQNAADRQFNTIMSKRFSYERGGFPRIADWLKEINAYHYFRKEEEAAMIITEQMIDDMVETKQEDENDQDIDDEGHIDYKREEKEENENNNVNANEPRHNESDSPGKKQRVADGVIRQQNRLPTFNMKVIDVRAAPDTNVYDITVEEGINSFTANGIVVHNCGATYQMEINHLTDPIDVYSEWIDKTEEANTAGNGSAAGGDDDEYVEEGEEDDAVQREKQRREDRHRARERDVDAEAEEDDEQLDEDD